MTSCGNAGGRIPVEDRISRCCDKAWTPYCPTWHVTPGATFTWQRCEKTCSISFTTPRVKNADKLNYYTHGDVMHYSFDWVTYWWGRCATKAVFCVIESITTRSMTDPCLSGYAGRVFRQLILFILMYLILLLMCHSLWFCTQQLMSPEMTKRTLHNESVKIDDVYI